MSRRKRPLHLVGSVPLGSADEAFRAVCGRLGTALARVPDGETGPRNNWIGSQVPVLRRHPDLEELDRVATLGVPDDPGRPTMPQFGVRSTSEGVRPFGSLGYGDAALESYAVFTALRSAGVVPASTRFQVSLPTPWASARLYVPARDRDEVYAAYRSRFTMEVADLLQDIPHDDLAIQWDVAVEIAEVEGALEDGRRTPAELPARSLADLVAIVPPAVETGFHFCYGDVGGAHFVQPPDLEKIVRLVTELGAHLDRRLSWIHVPVPMDRSNDAYFAALADLDASVTETLHLGLLHLADGLDGASRRVQAASTHLRDFGLATECGWGRQARASTAALLELHAAAASL